MLTIDDWASDCAKRDFILVALAEVPEFSTVQLNAIVEGKYEDVWGHVDTKPEVEAAQMTLGNVEGIGTVSINFGLVPNYALGT